MTEAAEPQVTPLTERDREALAVWWTGPPNDIYVLQGYQLAAFLSERDRAWRERIEGLIAEWEAQEFDPWYWSDAIEPLRALFDGADNPKGANMDDVHGWPFGVESACRLIAATDNPNERKENRDAWAVTMPNRPDVLEIEVERARTRLEQAIACVQSAADNPDTGGA